MFVSPTDQFSNYFNCKLFRATSTWATLVLPTQFSNAFPIRQFWENIAGKLVTARIALVTSVNLIWLRTPVARTMIHWTHPRLKSTASQWFKMLLHIHRSFAHFVSLKHIFGVFWNNSKEGYFKLDRSVLSFSIKFVETEISWLDSKAMLKSFCLVSSTTWHSHHSDT